MNIKDIDPFLRFVNRINFEPVKENCRAVDCHFYYMDDDCCPIVIEGVRYDPRLGSVVIVPAGTDYFFLRDGFLSLISINFDYTQSAAARDKTCPPVLSKSFKVSDITERPDFEDRSFLNKPIVLENMSYLRPHVEEILKEYNYKKQFYREIAASRFKNILFEIMRAVMVDTKSSAAVNTVLNHIHRHYAEPLDNAALSRIVGYHPYHLNRLMKSATGTTLHQYLINYRLETAKRYLQETDYSITEIAELCGYRNISNFSTDFSKKTGISPIRYREELCRMA